MSYKLTKKELETLGMRFAEVLLCRSSAIPEDLPELASRTDWKNAGKHERRRISADIAREARSILLRSGYPRETVEAVTRNLIK